MKLLGKKALVTGSSRGIGRAIAIGLAREGADIAVNYARNESAAAEVVEQIRDMGRQSMAIKADAGTISDVRRMVEEAWSGLGRIDALVNNAGVAFIEPFDKVTEETWDRTLNVNLKGAFFCSQITALKMIESGIRGRIVNVSATNGQVAEADTATYNASKGGLDMVTKSLAIELAPHGISVNAIAPGVIETEIDVDFFGDPKFKQYYLTHVPQGRFGKIDECIGPVVFYASEESSYITGTVLVIDGGLLAQQVPPLRIAEA